MIKTLEIIVGKSGYIFLQEIYPFTKMISKVMWKFKFGIYNKKCPFSLNPFVWVFINVILV